VVLQDYNVTIFSGSLVKDHARAGQLVTVKLTSKDGSRIKRLDAKINSRPASCYRKAEERSSLYCVVGVVRRDPNTLATFNITIGQRRGPTDSVTRVTDTSYVRVDTVRPNCTSVSIRSSNTNTSLATVGDVVTLSLVSTEPLQKTPFVSIAGDRATCSNTTAVSFSCSITVNSTTNVGNRARFVVRTTDVAGNRGVSRRTTDGSKVAILRATRSLFGKAYSGREARPGGEEASEIEYHNMEDEEEVF
jgi:hypothetical protein